jgi:hypothetical protein
MKPAIRLGALSHLKAIYIFTHDSMGLAGFRSEGARSQYGELELVRGIAGLLACEQ